MSANTGETVVVLTALPLERDAVCKHLIYEYSEQHQAGTVFTIGRVPGQPGEVVVALTGVGNQSAALITERAIRSFEPRAVLFTGIAGGREVVVATKVYSYHSGANGPDGQSRPEVCPAPQRLIDLAKELHRTRSENGQPKSSIPERQPSIHFKPIAVGERVLNSRETPTAKDLELHYSDAVAVDMESADVANVAHQNNVPALITRGISDQADGNKHSADKVGWQNAAADNTAEFTLRVARVVLRAGQQPSTSGTGPDQARVNNVRPEPIGRSVDSMSVATTLPEAEQCRDFQGLLGEDDSAAVVEVVVGPLPAQREHQRGAECVAAADDGARAELWETGGGHGESV